MPYHQRVLDIVPLTVIINIPMSEIPKKHREQYDLHIRIPADMGEKLKVLKKETGRSFADIISILIDGAKVGEYSE